MAQKPSAFSKNGFSLIFGIILLVYGMVMGISQVIIVGLIFLAMFFVFYAWDKNDEQKEAAATAAATASTTTTTIVSAPKVSSKEKSEEAESRPVKCRFCKKFYDSAYNGCPYCKKK